MNDETDIERNEEHDHNHNNNHVEDDGNHLEQNPSLNEEHESDSRYFIYNVQEATVVHREEEDIVLPVEYLNDHVRVTKAELVKKNQKLIDIIVYRRENNERAYA